MFSLFLSFSYHVILSLLCFNLSGVSLILVDYKVAIALSCQECQEARVSGKEQK